MKEWFLKHVKINGGFIQKGFSDFELFGLMWVLDFFSVFPRICNERIIVYKIKEKKTLQYLLNIPFSIMRIKNLMNPL